MSNTRFEQMPLFGPPSSIPIGDSASILKGFLKEQDAAIIAALQTVIEQAPFRNMYTPNGYRMSVAMTNCGSHGWVSDENGYRYSPFDPITRKSWPIMPVLFRQLAVQAAEKIGFFNFQPDVCLINRYIPGAKLSLHQDKDEKNFIQPIVSFSLGLSATFDFGGLTRTAPIKSYLLEHSDVVVWGGASRLNYHGVRVLKKGFHPLLQSQRINLTFRCIK